MLKICAAFILIVLLIVGCANMQHHEQLQTTAFKLQVLQACDSIEAKYVNSMYALFRIIDPKYADKVLKRMPDFDHFKDRVTDWANEHADRWEQAQQRLAYCDSLHLGTPIEAILPDIRWQLFIQNGAYVNELRISASCGDGDTCTIWTYVWQDNLAISCQSQHGESYPTTLISETGGFPLFFPITPRVSVSQFSSTNGNDVWLTVWVPGDQFTRATLRLGKLYLHAELRDSVGLVAESLDTADIAVLAGLLEAVHRDERRDLRGMWCIEFPDVRPGTYKIHVIVKGAPYNGGSLWMKTQVAPSRGLSDLMIIKQSKITAGGMLPGVLRGNRVDLYDNPEPTFDAGEKLNLYIEVQDSALAHSDSFSVNVTLHRVAYDGYIASTTIGDWFIVGDSLDQPLKSWGSVVLPDLTTLMREANKTQGLELFADILPATRVIESAIAIPKKVDSGDYVLTLTVTDKRMSHVYTAQRMIRIH